jgi:hypothetical protein
LHAGGSAKEGAAANAITMIRVTEEHIFTGGNDGHINILNRDPNMWDEKDGVLKTLSLHKEKENNVVNLNNIQPMVMTSKN